MRAGPQVVCVASPKGGSGKTSLAASIGRIASGLGRRVLLVDLDAATNGLTLLFLEEMLTHRDSLSSEVVRPRGSLESAPDGNRLYFEVAPNLWVMPTTYALRDTVEEGEASQDRPLVDHLGDLRNAFDIILLDAQAGAARTSRRAMGVADVVLMVSEYDPMSAEGVERMRRLLPDELDYMRTWICFNKVLPEFAQSLGEFLSVARYTTPVPWDADVVRAYVRRTTAVDMKQGNPYTFALMEILAMVFPGMRDEVTRWKSELAKSALGPVAKELRTIEEQLSEIQRAIAERQSRLEELEERPRLIMKYGGLALAMSGAFLTLFAYQFDGSLGTEFLVQLGAAAILSLGILFLAADFYGRRLGRRSRRYLRVELEERLEMMAHLKDKREQLRTVGQGAAGGVPDMTGRKRPPRTGAR